MAGSVNKVILVGNLGDRPETRVMQSGDKVCNLSVATSKSWKDTDGQKREKTEWNRVVVFNQHLVKVCEDYLLKGAKVYIEGELETRSWEQDGHKKYSTEVVVRPYSGELVMLDGKSNGPTQHETDKSNGFQPQADELEDEIPF